MMDGQASKGWEGRGGRGGGVGGGMVYLIQNSRGWPSHYGSRKKSALYWCKKNPWLCMEKPPRTT